ncbi:MAG: hypothetical protein NT036_06250, partial [Candidatus Omnitrophica bacterium]|nr:hypothetical protein [Candidatus Omnitrophota bacterium]
LVDVLKNIFTIGKVFRGILKKVDSKKTDLAILVDYPGFNLRLAKELSTRGILVIYYISPQIWAWGGDRINIIKKYVARILVFFKFEEVMYRDNGIRSDFVGNPLLETVKTTLPKDEILKKYGLSKEKPVIALLPGSRTMEVKTLLEIMARSAEIIAKELPGAQFVVAKYKNLPASLYEKVLKSFSPGIKIADGDAYNILSVSDFAIVASGTATLETAIIGTPFVITYRTGIINYIRSRARQILSRRPRRLPSRRSGNTPVPSVSFLSSLQAFVRGLKFFAVCCGLRFANLQEFPPLSPYSFKVFLYRYGRWSVSSCIRST